MNDEEEKEKDNLGYFKKMINNGQINQLIIIITTIVTVTIFICLAFLSLLEIFSLASPVDFLVLALLSATGIYGMFEYINVRRIHKIDSIFPDFVRDLAESRRAGMTITKSINLAAKGNYGILTEEIRKISQQISWGSSVADALLDFSKRVHTKSIQRTISLIIEASKSGGNVAEVLDIASKDAREIKMLEAERKSNMASYVVVIYVGMFVFLAIVMILNLSFIPAMIGSGSQSMAGIMGGGGTNINAHEVTNVFYFAILIQGLGSGLVAGVFEDGYFTSSVKHVFVMVLINWLIFKLMMGV
jgi:flagellar protein FlaJ